MNTDPVWIAGDAVATTRMRKLVDAGIARPLLPGRFPVPVELEGRWWHVPSAGTEVVFVPAARALAAQLADLDARYLAANSPRNSPSALGGRAPGDEAP
ncbi:MAG: hypothetical protein AB7I38_11620 [Dehalococcoidia bacterium]